MSPKRQRPGGRERLRWDERRQLTVLGLPTFALALAITAVATYLPVVAREFTASSVVIGLLIGGEGLMALWIPLIAGSWSDRLDTRFGGRLPFVLAGTPIMAAALLAMGVVGSLAATAVAVGLFFVGYFIAYEPYRALYPDLVDDRIAGRAQSNQAAWRGAGTLVALASGGALLGIGRAVPFVGAMAILLACVALFAHLRLRELKRRHRHPGSGRLRETLGRIRRLLAEHPALRAFMVANACWELSLGALKTFIVLYVTAGLGYSLGQASVIIGGVAVLVLGGALVSGKLADRHGGLRVMRVGLWVYGIGLLVPALTRTPAILLPALPVIAAGGGMIMGLPYALLIPLMPEGDHGALTGVYSLSRGVGTMLGPLLAGFVIEIAGPLYPSTNGYGAMWLVVAGAILASIPVLGRLRRSREDRRELQSGAEDRAPRRSGDAQARASEA